MLLLLSFELAGSLSTGEGECDQGGSFFSATTREDTSSDEPEQQREREQKDRLPRGGQELPGRVT